MKVILHIGQSKTGTSAIQAYLQLNKSALLRQGILYPMPSRAGMALDLASHNAVADSLVGLSRFPYLSADQYFAQFFEQAKATNARLMVLSGEHFFGGEPRIWDVENTTEYWSIYKGKVLELSRRLAGHDVSVIVYLRDQLSWLKSAIAQNIRTEGLVGGRRIYFNDQQFFEMARPILGYSSLLAVWRDVLRPSELRIVPYDRKNLVEGSSVADFFVRIGASLDGLDLGSADMVVNASLTREYLEVKKQLNLKPRSKTAERVAIRVLERLSRASPQPTSYDIDPGVSRSVIEFAEDENQRLAAEFGVHLESSERSSLSPPLTRSEIDAAMRAFEREHRKLKYRFLGLDLATRALLRRHAGPVHAGLHQIRRHLLARRRTRDAGLSPKETR